MFFNKREREDKLTAAQKSTDFNLSNEEVVEHFGDTVYRIALKMTKHEADAQDIFQDVFMRFIRYEVKPESMAHAKHWFIRTTINCCKTFFEYKKRQQLRLVELEPEVLKIEQPSVGDSHADYPELHDAVNQLDEKYRIVVHLFYFEEYKIKEIAKILDESEGTIKSKLNRARKCLKDLIQEE